MLRRVEQIAGARHELKPVWYCFPWNTFTKDRRNVCACCGSSQSSTRNKRGANRAASDWTTLRCRLLTAPKLARCKHFSFSLSYSPMVTEFRNVLKRPERSGMWHRRFGGTCMSASAEWKIWAPSGQKAVLPSKRLWIYTRPHGVTSHKIICTVRWVLSFQRSRIFRL
jgi:hypothetical protein